MLKQQHQVFVTLLAAADALVVTGACYAAWTTRKLLVGPEWWPERWEDWIKEPLVLAAVPLSLLVFLSLGLYRPRRDQSLWRESGSVIRAGWAAVLTVLFFYWAIGNEALFQTDKQHGWHPLTIGQRTFELDFGRVMFGGLMVYLPIFLVIHRLAVRLFLRALRRRGWNLRHVGIIGTTRLGQIVCRTLDRNAWTGIHPACFISHLPSTTRTRCLRRPILGGLNQLEEILKEQSLDAVYIALPNAQAAQVPKILQRLEKFAIDVRIVPDVDPRYVPQSMTVSELEGMPILSYRENPASGVGGACKRALDIVGGAAALLLFSPLMIAVAIAIKLDSRGPIIFRQDRVSLGGEKFRIYKFRTMAHATPSSEPAASPACAESCIACGDSLAGCPAIDGIVECPACGETNETACAVAGWTARGDKRITRIGAWLRKTSLDELPQLFNVLKGEMSLVGPRPERPELIERFREDWRGYMLRQHVKAGMTGWAQINGLRGDTSLRKRLQYDLFYVRNWSVGLDIRILAMTPIRGFVHRNAH